MSPSQITGSETVMYDVLSMSLAVWHPPSKVIIAQLIWLR